MALFLITGASGAGKTTTCLELKARGYLAYDGDTDKLACWYDKQTGELVSKRDESRTLEFVQMHSYLLLRDRLKKLAANAQDKPIFICCNPENMDELEDLFAKKFALVVDEATFRDRLVTRTNNEWGKLPHELEYSTEFRQAHTQRYEEFGYDTVDATLPTRDIVDCIVKAIGS